MSRGLQSLGEESWKIEDENFERERKARGEGDESGLGFSIWVL